MVNIYEQKLTNLQQGILRLLFVKSGKTLNALNIAKNLGVSQPAVSKSLHFLEKEEMINVKKDKESGRYSVSLNSENHNIIQLKRADNLKMIYESGLADFLEEKFAGAAIILFGSYSKGEDTINSDIDIAIIGRKEKEADMERFEKLLERKINLNFYESFKKIHKHLKENILNGIILAGGVEL
ncbi:ArsR family transcriptional regulator [Candidatus Pacearchaeota archaeon]|nr:ArsR family transcriptional regulator [Candidatus Pacearchaeota archaeon]